MLSANRDVIRKQNEALAHLQERNALGRDGRVFGGIHAVSAMFVTNVTQNEKSRFHGSALEPRGVKIS